MSRVMQQATDGRWIPAEPVGWREEHNLLQRFLFWLMRRPHCRAEDTR